MAVRQSTWRCAFLVPCCWLLLATSAARAEDRLDFNRDVRPILSNHCWSCHGPDEKARRAGLRLDVREAALAALESGATAIVPRKPDAGALVGRINANDAGMVMPPPSAKKPLTAQQKRALRRWIEEGAEFAQHWAFVPAKRPRLPPVKQAAWARTAIDFFVLERLEKAGLAPSPEASRAAWLRRVTLDLTGLAPGPEELDAFLADPSPLAHERVVDRLLQSPRCAERMAMQWLDAARYADTNGYNNDEVRSMWPWRDWVIEAFAQGMPYDQFITQQLAGDLLPRATVAQKVATGFNRNHVLTTEGGIIEEEYHVEYVADRVHTTATVFLGLSLQCARCHDHKYDPISQREFYQFAAFFDNVPDRIVGYNQGRMAEPLLKVPSAEQQAQLARLEGRRMELKVAIRQRGPLTADDAEMRRFKAELSELRGKIAEIEKAVPVTMVMQEMEPRRTTHILRRGQYDQRGEEVTAGVPGALSAIPTGGPANRLGLAKWLTSPAHPLTARVAVNRWWELLFGTGLVETAEDFGVQGASPSHPELLDWLATELIRTGWDQRAILRTIVLSATYRQSSQVSRELLERDPHNRLLARGPRYRLPAETLRDNALFVSGLLCERIGGPSAKPYQPEGLWEDVSVERRDKYVPDLGEGLYRRSMYTFWKRTCPPPGMNTLDAPDRETCVIRRARTNTPLQALLLLNDPTYVEAARSLAQRVLTQAKTSDERLTYAFKLVLCRSPTATESRALLDVYQRAISRFRANPGAAEKLLGVGQAARDVTIDRAEHAAWTTVMSVLLNLDEAISKS